MSRMGLLAPTVSSMSLGPDPDTSTTTIRRSCTSGLGVTRVPLSWCGPTATGWSTLCGPVGSGAVVTPGAAAAPGVPVASDVAVAAAMSSALASRR